MKERLRFTLKWQWLISIIDKFVLRCCVQTKDTNFYPFYFLVSSAIFIKKTEKRTDTPVYFLLVLFFAFIRRTIGHGGRWPPVQEGPINFFPKPRRCLPKENGRSRRFRGKEETERERDSRKICQLIGASTGKKRAYSGSTDRGGSLTQKVGQVLFDGGW